MNNITNRQVICETLMEAAGTEKDIVVLCSDSRGSASLAPFAKQFPDRFVEVGIAEQDLVSIAAGLASSGKKAFAASPACFLSTRSYEQVKVDVAYSDTNVTLIGISGGVSYGALGMSHHSLQDIAAMTALPNMRVYLPSDRHQTKRLMEELLKDSLPAYIRIGRNAVEDVYREEDCPFSLNKANVIFANENSSKVQSIQKSEINQKIEIIPLIDVAIIACGEMVAPSVCAANILKDKGIKAMVIDMYCIKPVDKEAVLTAAKQSRFIITVEEHSEYGGLGALVCQIASKEHPTRVYNLALPDEPVKAGTSNEVFKYYGLDGEGIAHKVMEMMKDV